MAHCVSLFASFQNRNTFLCTSIYICIINVASFIYSQFFCTDFFAFILLFVLLLFFSVCLVRSRILQYYLRSRNSSLFRFIRVWVSFVSSLLACTMYFLLTFALFFVLNWNVAFAFFHSDAERYQRSYMDNSYPIRCGIKVDLFLFTMLFDESKKEKSRQTKPFSLWWMGFHCAQISVFVPPYSHFLPFSFSLSLKYTHKCPSIAFLLRQIVFSLSHNRFLCFCL